MKQIFLTLAAIASLTVAAPATGVAGSVGVNIQLDAFLPAPPGVRVHVDAGRPYYIVQERRVYLEKKDKHDNGKHRGHDKGKHGHGKKDKHHD
jgi:hypothetical protein